MSAQTELVAIDIAADIISMSVSAIQSIQGDAPRNWPLLHAIYQHFNTIVGGGWKEVHLVWYPSDCEIIGNSEAKVASQGAFRTTIAVLLP